MPRSESDHPRQDALASPSLLVLVVLAVIFVFLYFGGVFSPPSRSTVLETDVKIEQPAQPSDPTADAAAGAAP